MLFMALGVDNLTKFVKQARLKIDGDVAQQNKSLRIKWYCPPSGKLKLNIDAAVDQRLGRVGVGAMIRDCNGHMIDVLAGLIPISISPFGTESIAIREALSWCSNHSLSVFIVENDCWNVIESVNSLVGLSTENILVEDIQSLVYSCGVNSCHFVARESNKVAHTLAELCFRKDFLSLSADVIWG
ncbi:Ribonuclease H-like domain containing protein [Trema orientale]|uniref:Ribonuclease H-like domain containing protein n=1 Tax=Trema orientale TaxID=63057 RepID=A0A2P5BM64_TREOI|nr:Ribonuclease H-like domain containing protein [Trema orientale]